MASLGPALSEAVTCSEGHSGATALGSTAAETAAAVEALLSGNIIPMQEGIETEDSMDAQVIYGSGMVDTYGSLSVLVLED